MNSLPSPELLKTIEIVFPGAPFGRRGADVYRALPTLAHARIVVPGDARRAAVAAVRGYGRLQPRRRAVLRRVAAAWLATPGGARSTEVLAVPAHEQDLRSHLQALLGRSDVRLAVPVRSLDPHSKPTVQVLSGNGQTLAFCKVGRGPAVRRMQVEAAALRRFEKLNVPGLRVPELLHEGPWCDRHLVVTAPVPERARRATLRQWPTTCRALFALQLGEESQPLGTSGWPGAVAERVSQLSGATGPPLAQALVETLTLLLKRHEKTPVVLASTHGDWVPWNLALRRHEVWCWDLEHSESSAPFGIDVVHGLAQIALRLRGMALDQAVDQTARMAGPVLEKTLHLAGANAEAVIALGLWDVLLRACEVRRRGVPEQQAWQAGMSTQAVLKALNGLRTLALSRQGESLVS